MVSLVDAEDAGALVAGVDEVSAEEVGAGDAEGVDAEGITTRSPPLVQPATVRTAKRVQQPRLLIPHSYRIRSRHDRDLATRP